MGRSRHKVKEIENTVQELEDLGWVWIKGKGHAWGILRCPKNSKDCRCGKFCLMSVWSTPQNPERFAKKLRQKALACVKLDDENGDDNG
jgi:hypothetical protein